MRIFKELKEFGPLYGLLLLVNIFSGELFTNFTRAFLFADDVMSDVLLVLAPFQLRPKKKIKN